MTDRYAGYTRLLFSRPAPGVLKIEMNRPDRYNATDNAMHHELVRVWKDVDDDPDVSVSLITGVGKAFSAGGDFEIIKENINDFEKRAEHWKGARDLVYNMINSAKPIVSAIRGPAAGAGLAVALLADISIAGKTAKIVDGHTRLGVAAGDHAAIVWPLLCGMAKAKYLLMLCEPLTGAQADELGLVSMSVEDAELEQRSLEVAERLATAAPTAIRWTKYAMNNWMRMAGPIFDTSLALEFLGFTGNEVREGLQAHLDKRKPQFDQKSPI
ncbi:enoyl-CoA hydratase/isomerase family protein [Bradyrhizobium sp. NP1]|uniref:enoyl-CoA hydratase/isomerase family protein n=1 Tax=Bradyrhizobium sp. NP1 TaxID=3049772 RepID=UPI0025A5E08F|nr:enoyl-CoA hydratase/isomerase family protein [Bradyrhizobium sp. NP1]WJR76622.1 enoyl-CoA hydratase/isomerase family protein [Bradyrhizobium sp. NP1]